MAKFGKEAELTRMPVEKYKPFAPTYKIPFDEKWQRREWPTKQITKAPRWCSVDLRDGNQALINPMNLEKKMLLFQHLLAIGYKEIEVGFPSASQTDFDFCREIIDQGLIPDGVIIQVLVQAREQLIRRTVEAVKGAKNVVIHIYNSTSELQRRVVFKLNRDAIKNIAIEGVQLVKKLARQELSDSNVILEYSCESFTGTELDFALEVCEAVTDTWQPTKDKPLILNFPATVEMTTPNIYADQIEWMCAHLSRRDCIIVSLHPHNDRGTGVAAAEQGLMAGADRVEGCLFGNGERTGNVCIVTLALNMYTQGVDPEVRYSDIERTIAIAEYCTELKIPERWPWAGSLVYTAFSGSHQDAIKKGFEANKGQKLWEVPYLPIDPADLGRTYEAIIRVNSQSGKGGIAYLLDSEYGISLPKDAQAYLSQVVQRITDDTGREITAKEIFDAFSATFLEPEEPLKLGMYEMSQSAADMDSISMKVSLRVRGATFEIRSEGNGPVSAFVKGLNDLLLKPHGFEMELTHYESKVRQQTQASSTSEAICSIQISITDSVGIVGKPTFGVSLSNNTTTAALRAVISAINCMVADGYLDIPTPTASDSAQTNGQNILPVAVSVRRSKL
jgi:2-isopropylmalate synthase|mmetsp:Transcript_62102/g.98020  ORF Transcript_62102/g.98020 Transcript_62102/m.98020 type:complete len:618 (+) Transcript_62102:50-1903(+)